MQTIKRTLPWLRIEYNETSVDSGLNSLNGFAILILGKTIIATSPMNLILNLKSKAESIRKELYGVKIDSAKVSIEVTVPVNMIPKVIWPLN